MNKTSKTNQNNNVKESNNMKETMINKLKAKCNKAQLAYLEKLIVRSEEYDTLFNTAKERHNTIVEQKVRISALEEQAAKFKAQKVKYNTLLADIQRRFPKVDIYKLDKAPVPTSTPRTPIPEPTKSTYVPAPSKVTPVPTSHAKEAFANTPTAAPAPVQDSTALPVTDKQLSTLVTLGLKYHFTARQGKQLPWPETLNKETAYELISLMYNEERHGRVTPKAPATDKKAAYQVALNQIKKKYNI